MKLTQYNDKKKIAFRAVSLQITCGRPTLLFDAVAEFNNGKLPEIINLIYVKKENAEKIRALANRLMVWDLSTIITEHTEQLRKHVQQEWIAFWKIMKI